jgi:PAS domain S-box-containing protein
MSEAAAPRPASTRGRRRGDAAESFRLLADFAPVMIWVATPDRRAVYFNRPWQEFTGRDDATELGFGWLEGVHPEDRERVERSYAEAFGKPEPFEISLRLRRHDGAWRWLTNKGVPLFEEGKLRGFAGSCLDITERIEDERAAREGELARERSARASAESETQARDQFLAIVSHELRSPLNGIKSWTHVLANQLANADPTVRRAIAGILIGVEHQVRLIDDLLDVTRALSGNLGLAKQRMPLLPVLADAVESLRATALEKDVQMETDYAIADREIHGDPDRIRQIFVNLITNAVKFTPAGGHIRVSAKPEGSMARIEVRDDGSGIDPDFLPYVFDPFRQADQGLSRRSQEGLGLGLALVQRLAQLHGGHVSCESDGPGRGATFRVHLPLHREAGARGVAEVAQAGTQAPALPSLAGIRVLLIDDQREARESLATLLSQTGAQVATAASCQEAMAHLALNQDSGREPEVIVCDIAMPGEDGYATLRRIRRWEASRPAGARSRRPAVALSAFTQREDRLKALAEGFQMHLAKPVAPVELATVISSVARGMRI